MRRKHSQAHGFTVVEIAVVVPLIIVIALAMFEILFAMTQSNDAERARTFLAFEREQAISIIEPDVLLTASFLPSIDSNVADSYAPSGGWSYTGSSSTVRTLILRTYSTLNNPLSTNRSPIYVGSGSPTCDPGVKTTNPAQTYDTIYFVDTSTNTLYRRRLVDSTTQTCGDTQYQKQSCPVAVADADPAHACPDDEVISNDVTGFSIDYYSKLSDASALNVYSGGAGVKSQLLSASGIKLTLTLSHVASGQTVSSSTSIMLARLNNGNSGY